MKSIPEEQEREAFEEWAGDQGFPLQYTVQGDEYQDLRTQGPWEAWQARASLAERQDSQALPEQPSDEQLIAFAKEASRITLTSTEMALALPMWRKFARAVLALAPQQAGGEVHPADQAWLWRRRYERLSSEFDMLRAAAPAAAEPSDDAKAALRDALDRYLRQDETAGDTDNGVYRQGLAAISAALSPQGENRE